MSFSVSTLVSFSATDPMYLYTAIQARAVDAAAVGAAARAVPGHVICLGRAALHALNVGRHIAPADDLGAELVGVDRGRARQADLRPRHPVQHLARRPVDIAVVRHIHPVGWVAVLAQRVQRPSGSPASSSCSPRAAAAAE